VWNRDEPLGALPYYIAIDRGSDSIVVAIRGTYSLADFATNMVASPVEANGWLPPSLQEVSKIRQACHCIERQ
jgi:hypothetical protein